MKLFTFIAYNTEGNLGKAYNECVELLDDDDWFFFLDHDATFVQRDWYKKVKEIIEKYPQYDLFTTPMNRCGSPYQLIQGVDKNNHDIRYHREIGKVLFNIEGEEVVDITKSSLLSGVTIIGQKKGWDKIGGAKDGFLGVDNDIHAKYRDHGMRVGLIRSLYVYHWYRGDGDTSHLKRW